MKQLLVVNVLFVVGFIFLVTARPMFTDMDVRGRYTQLDREGVINEDALRKFHPSFEFFPNTRNSVPRYVAGPALQTATEHALAGLGLAVLNCAVLAALLFMQKTRPVSNNTSTQYRAEQK